MSGRAAKCLMLTLLLAGCSREQRNEDFIPAEAPARDALEACLKSWVQGEAVSGDAALKVPNTHPQVLFAEPRRNKGRKLSGYTILGPVPAEAPRCFAVQLTFQNAPAETRDRYVVVGLDPIWVCQYDEYLMVSHWTHAMPKDGQPSPPNKQ